MGSEPESFRECYGMQRLIVFSAYFIKRGTHLE
ncbi:MAG: hypothetical protein BWY82_02314 [Verrucomicrobia bacterium ADurb.Bin474]|nr:MAG: hypothetical protein BWY82_02314 [Verrucomicrobia bacterium ADurb.Bin474]